MLVIWLALWLWLVLWLVVFWYLVWGLSKLQAEGRVNVAEYDYLLKGAPMADAPGVANPCDWLDDAQWDGNAILTVSLTNAGTMCSSKTLSAIFSSLFFFQTSLMSAGKFK